MDIRVVLLMVLFLSLGIFVAFHSARNGWKHKEWLQLMNNYFNGDAEVLVDVSRVKMEDGEIRNLARRRGYRDAGRVDQNHWLFKRVENPLQNAMYLDSLIQKNPKSKHHRKQQKWIKQLDSNNYVWVQPSELQMSIQDVVQLANSHGMQVARVLGDHSAPVLLLSRHPVRRIDEAIDHEAPPMLVYRILAFAIDFGAFAVFVVGVFTVGVNLFLIFFFIPIIAGQILPVIFPFAFAAPTVSQRLTWMLREFDGNGLSDLRIQEFSRGGKYAIKDGLVITDVARELGYQYIGYRYSRRASRYPHWRNQAWRYVVDQSHTKFDVENSA